MIYFDKKLFSEEFKKALSFPWRLPRSLVRGALFTFLGFVVALYFRRFHDTLPYFGASLFVWSLAAINATLLTTYSPQVIDRLSKKESFIGSVLIKNTILFILIIPFNVVFILAACWLLNDFTKFGLALILAFAAVIISMGIGNIVPAIWAYKPQPWNRMLHSRMMLVDYIVFSLLTYLVATFALWLTIYPASILDQFFGTRHWLNLLTATIILIGWAILCWSISIQIAFKFFDKHSKYVIRRFKGEPPKITNKHLKKILRAP